MVVELPPVQVRAPTPLFGAAVKQVGPVTESAAPNQDKLHDVTLPRTGVPSGIKVACSVPLAGPDMAPATLIVPVALIVQGPASIEVGLEE